MRVKFLLNTYILKLLERNVFCCREADAPIDWDGDARVAAERLVILAHADSRLLSIGS